MKKSYLISSLIAVVIIGGHYVLWQKAATHLTQVVEREIEITQTQILPPLDGTLDVAYSTFGYPFKIGVDINHYNMTFTPPQNGRVVHASLEGDLKIYTSLFNINKYSFHANPLKILFNATEKGVSEAVAIELQVENLSGNGVLDQLTARIPHIQLNMENAGVFIKNQKMMGITSINQDFTQNTVKDLSTLNWVLALEGLTLFTPPQIQKKQDIHIDALKVSTRAENISLDALKAFQAGMQASTNLDGSTDGKALRKTLSTFIKNIVDNNSTAFIDEISLKKGGFTATLKGNLKIDTMKHFDGSLTLHAEGLDELKKMGEPFAALATNPFLQSAITDNSFNLTVGASKGFASLNGVPMMALPNLENAIYYIPDEISASMPTGYIAP